MLKRATVFFITIISIQLAIAINPNSGSFNDDVKDDASKAFSDDLSTVEPGHVEDIYQAIQYDGQMPSLDVFEQALIGYSKLITEEGEKLHILSIVDFSLSSNEKRFWIIDLAKKEVLFHELVAHGMGTGDEFASKFSNQPESHQSSLGFFKTGAIYDGKHAMSLKLHGLESGINDLAYERGIVIHGADYVSEEFIQNNGRLGRSFGCPAVRQEVKTELIQTIADGSIFFAYYPSSDYQNTSQLVSGEWEAPDVAWLTAVEE